RRSRVRVPSAPPVTPGRRPEGRLSSFRAGGVAGGGHELNCPATSNARPDMLQALREKTSGWIAVVIVILLAVPFAFFGMEQYLFQSGANYAARVEAPPSWWRSAPDFWPVRKAVWVSRDVSPEEFRNEFELARQQARATQGDAFDARAFEQIENKLAVLDQLVDRTVLGLAAETAGLAVGDDQVREVLQAMPEFQVEGRFDPQRYQMLLQSRVPVQTPREHQEDIRARLQMVVLPR